MRVYLAGPMSGIPEHNYPAFFEGEEILEAMGYDVVNPARLDALTTEEILQTQGKTPDEIRDLLPLYLRRDFKELVHCDGLVLLDGWAYSAGANAELGVARWMDLPVWRLSQRRGWAMKPSPDMPYSGLASETWYRFGQLTYFEQRRVEQELEQEAEAWLEV